MTELVLLVDELRKEPAARSYAIDSNEQLIHEVVAYLTASYRERLSIDDLLKRFPVSRSWLLLPRLRFAHSSK